MAWAVFATSPQIKQVLKKWKESMVERGGKNKKGKVRRKMGKE